MADTAEKILIVGASETGKSTLARIIVTKKTRAVIFDPSGDWQRRGVQGVRNLKAMNEQMARKWHSGFCLAWTPPAGKEPAALDRLSQLVQWYALSVSPQGIVVVVDEAHLGFSNAVDASTEYGGFGWVVGTGRHYGVGFIAITQSPTGVAQRLRLSARDYYVFALHDANARKGVVGQIGREWEPAIRDLHTVAFGKARFIHSNQGVVRRGVLDLKNQRFFMD